MHKVLSDPANWPRPTPPVQQRQQEDFAERLHAEPRKGSGQSKADHRATTRDTVASDPQIQGRRSLPSAERSVGEKGDPTSATPSALNSDQEGADGGHMPTLDAEATPEGASTPPIGLRSETLTWSRVYPQHLVASGYLSMVATAARDGYVSSEPADGVAWRTPASGSGGGVRALTGDPDAEMAAATSLLDVLGPSAVATGAAIASDPKSEPLSATGELGAAMLADRFWAERLMRLTYDDAGSTVWLRDYRLKADDSELVVARLRLFGQREGVPISRVVINGHEVWRAPTSEGER